MKSSSRPRRFLLKPRWAPQHEQFHILSGRPMHTEPASSREWRACGQLCFYSRVPSAVNNLDRSKLSGVWSLRTRPPSQNTKAGKTVRTVISYFTQHQPFCIKLSGCFHTRCRFAQSDYCSQWQRQALGIAFNPFSLCSLL